MACAAFLSPCALAFENLSIGTLSHVTFEKITPTKYSNKEDTLQADVHMSSSILIKPFDTIRPVKSVSFLWKSEGSLGVKNAEQEEEKDGDDMVVRIGLMVSGERPLVPFFAPSWIKATEKVMKLPSDKIINLTVGARHAPGTEWESPYSSSISYRSIPSKPAEDGWQLAEATFDKPLSVVGYWIIADGDNTQSTFKTWVKNLDLK